MSLNFQDLQLQFAAHIKDPGKNPPPSGLDRQRLEVYRRLFFNNVTSFVSKAFPVLHSLYSEADWLQLVRSFYATHESHSPYFSDIAKEFLQFLENEYEPGDPDPPFLCELAHYELAELVLSIADDEIHWDDIDKDGDLLNRPPVLSPFARRFTYNWPVHRLSRNFQPAKPGVKPTHLILCRNHDGKINFILMNEASSGLIREIEKSPGCSGRQHIAEAAKKLSQTPGEIADEVLQGGLEILERMRKKEVLLGVRRR